MRSPTEDTTRIIKDAIGGLSLVKFDTSGYNLMNKVRFFSTAKCLHFEAKLKKVKLNPPYKSTTQPEELNKNYHYSISKRRKNYRTNPSLIRLLALNMTIIGLINYHKFSFFLCSRYNKKMKKRLI